MIMSLKLPAKKSVPLPEDSKPLRPYASKKRRNVSTLLDVKHIAANLFTSSSAAKKSGIPHGRILHLIHTKQIATVRIGERVFIPADALQRLAELEQQADTNQELEAVQA